MLQDITYAYIEFYVGMAKMVAYWHVKALGFELVAYRGPETGDPDKVSFLVAKNGINLVITSAATPACYEVLSFVDRHGNGVKRIAYRVENVEEAYRRAIAAGGVPRQDPKVTENENGRVVEAAIRLFDRKEIALFDGSQYNGIFKPGYEPLSIKGFEPDFDNGFLAVDHIAYGVHINEMDYWVTYFQKIFGGEVIQKLESGDVITEYSGLLLKLLSTNNGLINNVFVEPENHERPSQVQEYLEHYYGSGIQHMAFSTADIFTTLKAMRRSGVEFVQYPPSYFEMLEEESDIPADLFEKIREHNVLCDAQNGSYLFQTFTKPFGDRPTFFFEIIQRTGDYVGFALDNIGQLFRAVEREQSKRIEGGEKP
ncbi:MAG: 4-hydroxyphenylpyruvate dioxygenase [Acidobacteriota bacterium]|nr:4-hydroxyphenylpyruvate dioxygenase [Acidobacteriota bacterium]